MQHNKNDEVKELLEFILFFYMDDSIRLLDLVLSDDPDDPQYSAHTAYFRLTKLLRFNYLVNQQPEKSVTEYLRECGYREEDLSLFRDLIRKEPRFGSSDPWPETEFDN